MADQYEKTAVDRKKGIRYGYTAKGGWVPIGRLNQFDESWPAQAEFSAYKPKTGLAGIEERLQDWRTRLTQHLTPGQGEKVGEFMGSLPLGVMRLLQGGSEIPQGKVWQGTKDVVGGALQASEMPSMFIAPERSAIEKGTLSAAEGAKRLTDVVNPAAKQMEPFQEALTKHLDKVLSFAREKGLPLDSMENFGKAIKETGDAIRTHYYEKILGPVKDRTTLITGIHGYSGGRDGASATLKQLDERLSQINAELNPKFAKGGVAAQAAVKSASDLNAEAAGIREVLYREVAEHTGISPETVANTRQAFGALRDLTEKTGTSVSKLRHARNVAKQSPVTVNPFSQTSGKQFVVDKAIAALRGNPTDREIRQVLARIRRAAQ